MKPTIPLALLIFSSTIPANANADFNADLGKVVGAFSASELFVEHCNIRDPQNAPDRHDALAAWNHSMNRSSYDRFMQALSAAHPDVATQAASERERVAGLIEDDLDKNPNKCLDINSLLNDDPQFSVKSLVRKLVRAAPDLGIEVPSEPEITPREKRVEETRILRLATLSSRLETRMAEIGSKQGATKYRELSKAREEHAENWLKQDGIQLLFGRVTAEDEMREWRGDRQSRFKLECDSFQSDAFEERMANSIGQDMVVVGTVTSVLDGKENSRVDLKKCSLFSAEETGRPFVEEDDAAGLMARPLEENEAYAGPNAGIAMRDVEHVLYESSFDNRLDGFGNGYIDRKEHIYVLLKDGVAYRHDWRFPFSDLNVEQSRQREPQRWFTWQQESGEFLLTQQKEDGETKTLALAKPQQLQMVGQATLEAEYYYLQVAMGGHRTDRRYAFRSDGTASYSGGGFTAGNVAMGHITVTGNRNSVKGEAKYRFEDYTMVLETEDGTVQRIFAAIPQSADSEHPDTIIFGGQAYWLDKD